MDDTGVKQSLDFRLDCYHLVIRHLSEFLHSRLDGCIDVQLVLDKVAVHVCQIFGGLGKHIFILMEELDELRLFA
jgi:hypothetical protein